MARDKQSIRLARLSNDELLGALHGIFVAIIHEPEDAAVFADRGQAVVSVLRSRIGQKPTGRTGNRFNAHKFEDAKK
jgi:hypothetical protein